MTKFAPLVIFVILASSVIPSTSSDLSDDAVGLIVFKSGLVDPTNALSTWQPDDADTSPCSGWAHVICSPSSGRVVSVILSGLSLSGKLNRGLAKLSSLSSISLSSNNFSGSLSSSPFSLLPSLRHVDLSDNGFSSFDPSSFPHVTYLNLSRNRLSGQLPRGVRFSPSLSSLDLSRNAFSGQIPRSLSQLHYLESLDLSGNAFSGGFPEWVLSLTALATLDLSYNRLSGVLPTGNVSSSWGRMKRMRMRENEFSGRVPEWVMGLGLQELDLSGNAFSGEIPAGSARMFEALERLDLSGNAFSGGIPDDVALWDRLRELNLSGNEGLRMRLPVELGYLRKLSVLDVRGCGLYGEVPGDLCDSGSLTVLQLDGNVLSGPIPDEIGNCSSLQVLGLSRNQLNGTIPSTMGTLSKLEILNLEFNNLTGEIPPSLGHLPSLLALNLSHNRLVGRLPLTGIFPSLSPSAISDNLGLCSPLIKTCILNIPKPLVVDPHKYHSVPSPNTVAMRHRFLSISAVVALSAAAVIAVGVAVVTMLNASATRRRTPPITASDGSSTRTGDPAVGKLVLFSGTGVPEDLLEKAVELGRGTLGPVYRAASLKPNRPVAVRKLNAADVIPYHDEFDREVRALAKARHPNLVPVKGYYWTPQVQLLVTRFVPGGSLKNRLRCGPPLTWPERFRIVAGSARGLAHLHQAFRPPIIHYNFKPSNVLLSDQGDALVADFGLTRLLSSRATYPPPGAGYVAPEIACRGLRVNERCDVYSFGVVVMELVTGRMAGRMTGEDDVGELVEDVRERVEGGRALECVDSEMGEYSEEEVVPVLKLALVCTSNVPSSRPTMAEVVQILQVIGTPLGEAGTCSYAADAATSSSF